MLRRPILPIVFCYASGILFCYYLGLCCTTLAAVSAMIILWKTGRSTIALFGILVLLGAAAVWMTDAKETPLQQAIGKEVTIVGRITSIKEDESSIRVKLVTETVHLGTQSIDSAEGVLLNVYHFQIPTTVGGKPLKNSQSLCGKRVTVRGIPDLPKSACNPGTFDYRLYLKTQKIRVILTVPSSSFQVIGEGNQWAGIIAQTREGFSRRLSDEMGLAERALFIGMMFGDTTLLEEDIEEAFRENGTTHVLAVSGIHITLIYVLIDRLLGRRRTLPASVLTIFLLVIYAALSSFAPSVVRAVVMIALHLLSRHLHRRYDLACCAGFSALLFLIVNPFLLFHVGFQLSYLAVLTVAFLLPFSENLGNRWVEKKNRKEWLPILNVVIPSFTIQLGMLPATIYLFQFLSFSAFLVNIPVIAISDAIISLGMLLFFLQPIGGVLFSFVATAIEVLARLTLEINLRAARQELAAMMVVAPSIAILVLFYGAGFFLVSELFWEWVRARQRKPIAAVLLLILIGAACLPVVISERDRNAEIVFVDVGQGDCIHIRTPSGQNILIDGGGSADYDVGKKVLLPYLLKNGVGHIDMAIVTHLHEDHFGGIASLCSLMRVDTLGVYAGNRVREEELVTRTGLNHENLCYLSRGNTIDFGDGVTLEILAPKQSAADRFIGTDEEQDENDYTLVLRIVYEGISILVTGDLGIEGEERLLRTEANQIDVDLLKVGHHGSAYSTGDAFLEAVSPSAAIIQVGRNNYGHPSAGVIEKMEKQDIMVRRTDENGAVLVDIDDGTYRLRSMR